ncbi:hypothetical protein SK128_018886, partial [Halocaridina rubra]
MDHLIPVLEKVKEQFYQDTLLSTLYDVVHRLTEKEEIETVSAKLLYLSSFMLSFGEVIPMDKIILYTKDLAGYLRVEMPKLSVSLHTSPLILVLLFVGGFPHFKKFILPLIKEKVHVNDFPPDLVKLSDGLMSDIYNSVSPAIRIYIDRMQRLNEYLSTYDYNDDLNMAEKAGEESRQSKYIQNIFYNVYYTQQGGNALVGIEYSPTRASGEDIEYTHDHVALDTLGMEISEDGSPAKEKVKPLRENDENISIEREPENVTRDNERYILLENNYRKVIVDNTTLKNQLSLRSSEIEKLKTHLSLRSSEIERLTNHLSDRSSKIERLTNHLSDRSSEIERLTNHLSDRSSEIKKLTGELFICSSTLEKYKRHNKQCTDKIATLTNSHRQLESYLQNCVTSHENMKKALAECVESEKNLKVTLETQRVYGNIQGDDGQQQNDARYNRTMLEYERGIEEKIRQQSNLSEKIKNLQDMVGTVTASLTDQQNEYAQYAQKVIELKREFELLKNDYDALEKRKIAIAQTVEQAEQSHAEFLKEKGEAVEQLRSNIDLGTTHLNRTQEQLTNLRDALTTKGGEYNILLANIETKQTEYNRTAQEADNVQKALTLLQSEYDVLKDNEQSGLLKKKKTEAEQLRSNISSAKKTLARTKE